MQRCITKRGIILHKKLQPIVQRSAADLYCSLDLIALRLDVVSKGEIGSNISHKITMNYTTIPMKYKVIYPKYYKD